jgi:hypothetical protein
MTRTARMSLAIDRTTDLRPSNAAANVCMYHISPEYLHAEGTTLLSGRAFTWRDDKDSPRVAVINQQLARKLFGSVTNAIGGYYKMPDGNRVQVVGITEDGKYSTLTEDPRAAIVFQPAAALTNTYAAPWPRLPFRVAPAPDGYSCSIGTERQFVAEAVVGRSISDGEPGFEFCGRLPGTRWFQKDIHFARTIAQAASRASPRNNCVSRVETAPPKPSPAFPSEAVSLPTCVIFPHPLEGFTKT